MATYGPPLPTGFIPPATTLTHPEDLPRRFYLHRTIDISGISGVGAVAFGAWFPDGRVSLRWRGVHPTTTTFDALVDLRAIHGHRGATVVVWLDPDPDGNWTAPDDPDGYTSDLNVTDVGQSIPLPPLADDAWTHPPHSGDTRHPPAP